MRTLKTIIKNLGDAFGVHITRKGQGGPYTLSPAFGYATYSPWFEPWFQEVFAPAKPLVSSRDDRCYTLYRFAQHCAHLPGDFAECGVFRGGTAWLAVRALREAGVTNKEVHLFDTFAGMPDVARDDASTHLVGDLNQTSADAVAALFRDDPFVKLHPGVIPDTLPPVAERRFAFVHVDVDLYASTRDSFAFFYDRMTPGGVMLCDDYGFPAYERSAKLAVDEFFDKRPEKPIVVATGQCFIIKR